ncbi:hypothetical protein PLICRDRAFT_35385 [Plicaturopsis crispa FD-325 SS-3]|nr:hypothetical protein PLICRDRAFT_35385 [Plicaturopsis crispa FD-325 SS-3]
MPAADTRTVPTATRRGTGWIYEKRTNDGAVPTAPTAARHTANSRETTHKVTSPTSLPNQVDIQLSTTINIPNYTRYYHQPIESFRPTYVALQDGSLVAPPFLVDMRNASIHLAITGAMLLVFARNTVVSAEYIRRAKVKRKTLFYLLFVSQFLGVVSSIPTIVGYFDQSTNCVYVNAITTIAAALSLGILITGILGVKAYRCLNNSRIVLVMLTLFRTSSTVLTILDLVTVPGEKRLTGDCCRGGAKGFLAVFVIIQCLESAFICGCFVVALWRSRGKPSVRGRISIQLSMADDNDATAEGGDTVDRRGWWDYIPKASGDADARSVNGPPDGIISRISEKRPPAATLHAHQPSLPSTLHESHPPRPTTVRISEATDTPSERRRESSPARAPSPTSSTRLSRLMPRMVVFREVMRDELCYTTFITACFVVALVLAVIGISMLTGLSSWIGVTWIIISVFAMHSFSRVIRRHEHDALLQHPSAWNNVPPPRLSEKAHPQEGRLRGLRSPMSIGSYPHMRRIHRPGLSADISDADDPFENPSQPATASWYSGAYPRTATSIPCIPSLPDTDTIREVQSPVPSVSTLGRGTPPAQECPDILPSPNMEMFPTSGRNTPIADDERASIFPRRLTPGGLTPERSEEG